MPDMILNRSAFLINSPPRSRYDKSQGKKHRNIGATFQESHLLVCYCCSYGCGNVENGIIVFQVSVVKSKTFQWIRHFHTLLNQFRKRLDVKHHDVILTFTTCYSWSSHIILFGRFGSGVNILSNVLLHRELSSYTSFRI